MNNVGHVQDLNVQRSYLLRSLEHDPSRKLRANNLLHADGAEVD